MKNIIDITFEIQFSTPFHSGSGLSEGLVHRCVKKDRSGILYIPATTYKGILRNKVEEFINCINTQESADIQNTGPNDHHNDTLLHYFHNSHKLTPVERLFGSVVQPGTLYFENLVMNEEDRSFFRLNEETKRFDTSLQVESRTQTRVYRSLGTVKQGALFSSEYGLKDLRFEGRINGCIKGTPFTILENKKLQNFTYELFFLLIGMKLMNRMAGNKSIGMGQFDYTKLMLKVNKHDVDIEHDLFHDDFFKALCLYKDEMEMNETV